MSNYKYSVHFLLNFISASVLRPDLSGNPFYKNALGKALDFIKRLGAEGGNWRPNNMKN